MLFVDESHQTVPQIGAMARGDHRRKITLAEYGFRLPSCIDNRPLRFNEWDAMRPQTTFVSATPGPWEMNETGGVFSEQVIRPTGLIDPPVEIKPVEDQVDDLVNEAKLTAKKGYRTLVTTLTKRMAEDLTEYLHEAGLKVRYMHSDVETLERIELIRERQPGAARRHRLGQDLHHGQGDRDAAAARRWSSRRTRSSPPSSTASSRASSPTMRSNISSATTIITSPRPTSRAPTPTSRRKAR